MLRCGWSSARRRPGALRGAAALFLSARPEEVVTAAVAAPRARPDAGGVDDPPTDARPALAGCGRRAEPPPATLTGTADPERASAAHFALEWDVRGVFGRRYPLMSRSSTPVVSSTARESIQVFETEGRPARRMPRRLPRHRVTARCLLPSNPAPSPADPSGVLADQADTSQGAWALRSVHGLCADGAVASLIRPSYPTTDRAAACEVGRNGQGLVSTPSTMVNRMGASASSSGGAVSGSRVNAVGSAR